MLKYSFDCIAICLTTTVIKFTPGYCCISISISILIEVDLEISCSLIAAAACNNVSMNWLHFRLYISWLFVNEQLNLVLEMTSFLPWHLALDLEFIFGSGYSFWWLVTVSSWPFFAHLESKWEGILSSWHHSLVEAIKVLVCLEEFVLTFVSFNFI